MTALLARTFPLKDPIGANMSKKKGNPPKTIEWNQHRLKRHALYSVGLVQQSIFSWSKFAHARVKLDLMSAGASFAT